LNEDAPAQTVGLSGISAGPANESNQPLSVAVTSSNPAIIPTPSVSYSSPNGTGSLTFAPLPEVNTAAGGPVTITVVVNDGQGLNNTVTRTFTVTVTPINDSPTLDPLSPLTVNQEAVPQTVSLTGISAGPANEADQPLTVTATSSNPALIPIPVVT